MANPKGNPQNFKPLSTEEARKRGSAGGKRSVEVRRERKTLREELILMLEDPKAQKKMCVAQLKKAQKGDTTAFTVIRDTIGEKPMDKVANVNFNRDLNINNEDVDHVIEQIKDIAGF